MKETAPKFWRRKAVAIITQVLLETLGLNERRIQAALDEAYPLGEREGHSFKVWTDEIKRLRRKKAKAFLKQGSLFPDEGKP